MRPRVSTAVVAVIVSILALSAPVAAGSESDPEISLECAAGAPYYSNYLDSAAVCAVWFESDVDEDGVLRELRTTLRFAGDPRERPPVFSFAVRWNVADCYQAWEVSDVQLGLREPTYQVIWRCGQDDETRVEAPLEQVSFSEDRLTVRWPVDQLPPEVADRLDVGVTLNDIVLREFLRIDPELDVAGVRPAAETAYTTTSPDQSRPYVIGS